MTEEKLRLILCMIITLCAGVFCAYNHRGSITDAGIVLCGALYFEYRMRYWDAHSKS